MFKNIVFYRTAGHLSASALAAKLHEREFNHCGSHSLISVGFSPVVDGSLVHEVGKNQLISFSVEKKLLPASVVKEFVNAEIDKIIEAEGERPKRKRIKDIKAQVIDRLLPKAFGVRKDTLVWIDPVNGWLCINSASRSVVDQFMTAFFACVNNDLKVTPVETVMSPSAAMTDWLVNDNAPAGFSIDQDCLLKNPDSNASLRFSKHPLEGAVADHIGEGKVPTELAMTWKERVSFTLGADQSIKKIKLLDIVMEGVESVEDPIAAMNADATLCINELVKLIPGVIDALGGE